MTTVGTGRGATTRGIAAFALAVCLIAVPGRATNETTALIVSLWQEAVDARDAGDYKRYGDTMTEILEYEPGHPAAMRHLARSYALRGQPDPALSWLEKTARSGIDPGIEDDEYLASLEGSPDLARIERIVAECRQPLGKGTLAFALDERDFLPEGIAYDPEDDVFYLGSIRRRKIVRIHRDGSYEDFAAPKLATFYGVLGLRVVAPQRQLWAACSEMAGVNGYDPATPSRAAIHVLDLDTGAVLQSWHLADSTAHNINDIVVTSGGVAYATGAYSGALYSVRLGDDTLRTALPEGTLYGPNGLTLSRDESRLYVSQYSLGIALVDLAGATAEPLRHGEEINVVGIDGLYYNNGALIAVQNFLGMQQVTWFRLNHAGDFIDAARILERHDPHFFDPTTGAIASGSFFLVANSQLPRVGQDGSMPAPKEFTPTYIVELPLP